MLTVLLRGGADEADAPPAVFIKTPGINIPPRNTKFYQVLESLAVMLCGR